MWMDIKKKTLSNIIPKEGMHASIYVAVYKKKKTLANIKPNAGLLKIPKESNA